MINLEGSSSLAEGFVINKTTGKGEDRFIRSLIQRNFPNLVEMSFLSERAHQVLRTMNTKRPNSKSINVKLHNIIIGKGCLTFYELKGHTSRLRIRIRLAS